MYEQKKFSLKPGIIGCFMSVLLIVSFFLPRIWQNNSTVESFNTVLIVIITCLAIHLVRITSALFFEHVWNNIGYSLVWLLPVTNLIVIACQFVFGQLEFMQSAFFLAILVLLSFPVFCCLYFSLLAFQYKENKAFVISTVLIDAIGLLYCINRFADRVILPVAEHLGHEIANFVKIIADLSPWFSLVIYILAFFNFIICALQFNRVTVK